MNLSNNMYATLQRMKTGTEFLLRGDKAIGVEISRDASGRRAGERNCRSIPPLMRLGLIDFSSQVSDMTRYYKVVVTEKGCDMCFRPKLLKDR